MSFRHSITATSTHSAPRARHARIALATMMAVGGLTVSATAASASSWYVDGVNGGGQSSAGTAAAPFMYLWEAEQKTLPGDTIYVVPSMTYAQLALQKSGTATAPVTMVGSDPANPTKVSGGGTTSGIWIDGNYVTVRNFDVTAPGHYTGISIAPNQHHITIDSNVVHDAGGSGINTIANDYVTVSNNVVYGNAKNTTQNEFGSGISFLGSVDTDTNTGTKMRITNNIVYLNTNVPNCSTSSCLATASDSDGSGIILDDNQRRQFDNIPYKGAFLVANNVIFQNGGRGVHVFRSDNAVLTGNTMWENNQDPYEGSWHPGEVNAYQSGNVRIFANVLYSDGANGKNPTGTAPNSHVMVAVENCTGTTGPVIAQNNVGYNPQADATLFYYTQGNTAQVSVTNNAFADPQLESAATADFRVKPGSPAYQAANMPGTSVAQDIVGATRQPAPSIGAYQQTGP